MRNRENLLRHVGGILALALLSLPALPVSASGASLFSGLWRAGNDAHSLWVTSDWDDFTDKWEQYESQGLRMHDFETYVENGVRSYAGVYRQGSGSRAAWITSDWDDFTDKWDDFVDQGLRMHDFETYVVGSTRMYAGIFRQGSGRHAAWFTADWNSFTTKWEEFGNRGLRMHDFETYMVGRSRMYAGIFRAGNDPHSSFITSDWNDFIASWESNNSSGLRMHDYEVYVHNGTTFFAGIYRGGSGPHYAWLGREWEDFTSKWAHLAQDGLRLVDLEITPGACSNTCSNQVVMHENGLYNYGVTRTALHCPGEPGTCGTPGPGATVLYRQPVDVIGGVRYVRHSALDIEDQIFTLPFRDTDLGHNGWLYSPGNWHHAVDYWKPGGATFDVVAAAPGRVIHVGWDNWSGGTIVLSHDVGGEVDKYRTIYMHLRNGANSDCAMSWSQTVAWLGAGDTRTNYMAYLEATGCSQNAANRNPQSSWWGTDADGVDPGLLGQDVERGQFLAKAGSTGPGGCGCANGGSGPNNHLHIFFAHRDPQNDLWYFFDPYGIYGPSECYPSGMTDSLDLACRRYPSAWLSGSPQYPPTTGYRFRRGDSNQDGSVDISDPIQIIGVMFLGWDRVLCEDAADVNDDGELDISDGIAGLRFLFDGAVRIPPPGVSRCGRDPTSDRLGCLGNRNGRCQ